MKVNKFITSGKVIQFSGDYRGRGGTVDFVYVIKGRQYRKTNGANVYRSEGYRFVGKQFPVVVDSTDFSNSRILLTSKDFHDYDLPLPDTLEWVKQYERH